MGPQPDSGALTHLTGTNSRMNRYFPEQVGCLGESCRLGRKSLFEAFRTPGFENGNGVGQRVASRGVCLRWNAPWSATMGLRVR